MSQKERGDGSEPFITRRPEPLGWLNIGATAGQLSTMPQYEVESWNVVEHGPALEWEKQEGHDVVTRKHVGWDFRGEIQPKVDVEPGR
jgi:hypothetical protein